MSVPMRTSGTAIASLVLGISSWVAVPILGAIAAVICGHLARSEIRRMPPNVLEGDGMAIAGLILGYANLALFLLVAVGMVLIFGVALSAMSWG